MDIFYIHAAWIIAGAGFGYYMYKQGLMAGAAVGIKSALMYLSISGKETEAAGLRKFISDLGTRGFAVVDDEDDDPRNQDD